MTQETAYRRGRHAGETGILVCCNPFTAREAQIDWLQGYVTRPRDRKEAKRASARLERLKLQRKGD